MLVPSTRAIALTALTVALSGSAYAVVAPAKNSIGSQQIKKGAVHTSDLGRGSVTANKIRDGAVGSADLAPGALPAKGDVGPQGQPGATGAPGPSGAPGAKGEVGPTEGFVAAGASGAVPPDAPSGTLQSTTITTSAAGALFAFARGTIRVDCSIPGTVKLGLFVDDVAVPASGHRMTQGAAKDVSLFGLSAPVSAGAHIVTMKRQCEAGVFTGSSYGGDAALGAILLGD